MYSREEKEMDTKYGYETASQILVIYMENFFIKNAYGEHCDVSEDEYLKGLKATLNLYKKMEAYKNPMTEFQWTKIVYGHIEAIFKKTYGLPIPEKETFNVFWECIRKDVNTDYLQKRIREIQETLTNEKQTKKAY